MCKLRRMKELQEKSYLKLNLLWMLFNNPPISRITLLSVSCAGIPFTLLSSLLQPFLSKDQRLKHQLPNYYKSTT